MTATMAPTAGIDISKDRLDVALHPAGDARQFANDRRGHGKLLRWLGKRAVACVVFEATGAYGGELERRLETVAGWRKSRFRGLARTAHRFHLGLAACNLARMPKLLVAEAG